MASTTYQLVVRSGPNPGKVYELNGPQMSLGRETSNEIVVSDVEVSRRHARLTFQAGTYLLEDNGSTNGTFVDGKRLMGPHLLRPGELIRLGENVSLAFEAVGMEASGTQLSGSPYSAQGPAAQPIPPTYPPVGATPLPQPLGAEPQPLPPAYPQGPAYSPQPAYAPPSQPQAYPSQPPAYQPDPYAGAGYSNQVPVSPSVQAAPPTTKKKLNPMWIVGGCGCLVIVLCLALGGFMLWVDADPTGARWCQYFGAILNIIDPAACQIP